MSVSAKSELRRAMNKVLRSLSAVHRMETSNAISTMLQKIPEYTSAKSVAVFLSMKTEVDTVPIVQYCSSQDKKLLVPKIISDCEFELVTLDSYESVETLPKDKWGIPIPAFDDDHRMIKHPESTPDVIIVPGVAFDRQCQRMGHGKGYYGMNWWRGVIRRSLLRVPQILVFSSRQTLSDPYCNRFMFSIRIRVLRLTSKSWTPSRVQSTTCPWI